MIEERFTDEQRQRLVALVIRAVPHEHGDPELTAIISRLAGCDTVIVAHRAYPSVAGSNEDLPPHGARP